MINAVDEHPRSVEADCPEHQEECIANANVVGQKEQ